jgi:hypothetical protein
LPVTPALLIRQDIAQEQSLTRFAWPETPEAGHWRCMWGAEVIEDFSGDVPLQATADFT